MIEFLIVAILIIICLIVYPDHGTYSTGIGGSYEGGAKKPPIPEFPFKKRFYNLEKEHIFDNLKKVKPEKEFLNVYDGKPEIILPDKYFPKVVRDGDVAVGAYKDNKYYLLKFIWPEHYEKYHVLSDHFIEEVRIRANVQGYPSPREFWRKNYKRFQHLSLPEQREAVYAGTRETSQFKNTLAKYFYTHAGRELIGDDFAGKLRILDSSSGWGDRLLAALSCNAEEYWGYDPNTKLQYGYSEMMKLNPDVSAKVVPEPFETAKLPDNHFHCCLCGPPYFKFEIYSHTGDQSVINYDTEDAWLTHFAKPMVKNIYDALVPDGLLFLYLSDNRNFHLTNDVMEYCIEYGFKYMGVIFAVEANASPKPTWVFKK